MATLNVRTVVESFLKKNNYDGLCSPIDGCSCFLKSLMPCDHYIIEFCRPGYAIVTDGDCAEGFDDKCINEDRIECKQCPSNDCCQGILS